MQKPSDRDHVWKSRSDAIPLDAACDLELLVRAMQAGEVAAFSRFYQITVRQVFGVAHDKLRSREDAEEIVLDVYLYAWRNASAYDSARGSVRTWLSMMTKHRAIDRLRRRRTVVSFDEHQHESLITPVAGSGPEQTLVRLQSSAAIDRAFESLSEERRTLVRLAFVDGLTHEEIAAVVGRPLGTVKSHVRRALAEMHRQLATIA